ncbi:MAG: CHAD domain-containing protein [Nitrospira sp.]
MKQQDVKGTLQAETVRDALLGHIEMAVKAIRTREPSDEQIHSARKELKRARADLRLLRQAIGQRAYARENAALRDAARPLSGVRDAAVLKETVEMLIKNGRSGARRTLLLNVRRALERARREARTELRMLNAAKESVACLVTAAGRMRQWKFKESYTASLYKGLQRTYKQGRAAFRTACADPTNERLHEWRKEVKYLGQSMEVWKAHGSAGVKKFVKLADKLADILGDDHDLAVFEERLEQLVSPHPIRPAITRDIIGQRVALREKALKKGHRFFNAKPRSFVRKIVHQG